jgi:8-amino-7-oxononanoate synthase
MSRFDAVFQQALSDLARQGRLRGTRALPDGLLNVSSNDYLGLSRHPVLIERSRDWAARHGTGAGASRLVTGTLDLHQEIEAKIARLKGTEAALLLASGWQANASVLCSLLRLPGPPPLVVFDALNHASLHHACRAAGVRPLLFRHNDMTHLAALLEAEAGRPARRFIVTESVFSMDGDQADMIALRTLADRHDAFLYLDEAHATGVLGPGGMGLSCSVAGGVDLALGTFSKALGGFGAYVAGSRALCDWLVNRASGFIHTTALPPPVLGAIDAALDLVPAMAAERARLLASAARLRAALAGIGIDHGRSTTQIVPAIVGTEAASLELAARLRAEGILAIAIRPPTVPAGTSRLRLALSACHTDADLDRLAGALARAWPALSKAA